MLQGQDKVPPALAVPPAKASWFASASDLAYMNTGLHCDMS